MKKNIYRITYIVLALLFYYVFLVSSFNFEIVDYPESSFAELSMASLVPGLMFFIAILFTPFIIGWGVFLFFKYPKQKRGDFWHYCLIYPGFAIFVMIFLFLIFNFLTF